MKSMKSFVIAFSVAQGSTAIEDILKNHPEILVCGTEPFDFYKFDPQRNQKTIELIEPDQILDFLTLFFEEKYDLLKEEYSRYTESKLFFNPQKLQGFKFRLAEYIIRTGNDNSLEELLSAQNTMLISLQRKSILEQTFSYYKGVALHYAVRSQEISLSDARKKIMVDTTKFARCLNLLKKFDTIQESFCAKYKLRNPENSINIFYEDFINQREKFYINLLQHLGVDHSSKVVNKMLSRGTTFTKIHSSCLEDYIENIEELYASFPNEAAAYKSIHNQ